MLFRKKRIRIRKYKKLNVKTYRPEPRIELSKENTFPFFIRVGQQLALVGGFISFFASSLLMGIKGIFGIQSEAQRIFRGKDVELRIRKR